MKRQSPSKSSDNSFTPLKENSNVLISDSCPDIPDGECCLCVEIWQPYSYTWLSACNIISIRYTGGILAPKEVSFPNIQ
jgi:hypothetical protein